MAWHCWNGSLQGRSWPPSTPKPRRRSCIALARQIFREPIAIDGRTVDLAFTLMRRIDRLKARDAVHAAVVLAHGLHAICSYDRDFDEIPGVRRVQPEALSAN